VLERKVLKETRKKRRKRKKERKKEEEEEEEEDEVREAEIRKRGTSLRQRRMSFLNTSNVICYLGKNPGSGLDGIRLRITLVLLPFIRSQGPLF
jgi:uncharacterized membrane protein YdbT with pleckstrin-like domain